MWAAVFNLNISATFEPRIFARFLHFLHSDRRVQIDISTTGTVSGGISSRSGPPALLENGINKKKQEQLSMKHPHLQHLQVRIS